MSHPSNKVTLENVANVIRYRPPNAEQIVAHAKLANGAEAFIRCIIENTPDCADRSAAIRHVRDAKMTASAAVALSDGNPS